jgi:hypothetical protein
MNRRIQTLLVKAHELWDDYGVDVAVVLRKSRYCTYRSTSNPAWPPSMAEIVSSCLPVYLPMAQLTLEQEETYPIPRNLLPSDIEERLSKRRTSARREAERTILYIDTQMDTSGM